MKAIGLSVQHHVPEDQESSCKASSNSSKADPKQRQTKLNLYLGSRGWLDQLSHDAIDLDETKVHGVDVFRCL
jgi:hypothetical protein